MKANTLQTMGKTVIHRGVWWAILKDITRNGLWYDGQWVLYMWDWILRISLTAPHNAGNLKN